MMGVTDAEFSAAKERVGTLTQDPGNEVKLKMYALFKQVTYRIRWQCLSPSVRDKVK